MLTDTVGFIKELPEELLKAFSPTLEELREADLLLHIVDISNPDFSDHIKTVEELIVEMALDAIPYLMVFNKNDLIDTEENEAICAQYETFSISARKKESLKYLTDKIIEIIFINKET